MRILGIDPGIADTGWGVIDKDKKGKLVCVAYGSVKTQVGRPLAERLETLYFELEKIIKEHSPAQAGVEELFFCNNAKTALIVGQARGVAMLALRLNRLSVSEFTPLQVKQAVAAYGQAGKTQIQKMVKMLLGLDELPKPDDAADALAVAICAANSRWREG